MKYDTPIEELVSELQKVARSQKVDSGDLYLFFKSLRDVSLLIQQQLGSESKDLNSAFQLDRENQVEHISLPVVKLAQECLAGEKDGLFEVYSGLALLRSLANSEDHIDTFNEEGTEHLIKILCGFFKNSKVFLPVLLRYRASVLLLESIRYPKVAEKVLNTEISKLHSQEPKTKQEAENNNQVKEKASRSRSRSKEKDRKKKEKKSKRDSSPSTKRAEDYSSNNKRLTEDPEERQEHETSVPACYKENNITIL